MHSDRTGSLRLTSLSHSDPLLRAIGPAGSMRSPDGMTLRCLRILNRTSHSCPWKGRPALGPQFKPNSDTTDFSRQNVDLLRRINYTSRTFLTDQATDTLLPFASPRRRT
ncbi:hypothetical protein NSND_61838 [Nitrospira sp. ND1]|nr:hypothetical protein NSND_61838 [Nitrospira sp. ND1]